MIFRPDAEWDVIANESTTVGSLLLRYIVPLCLLPSVATVIGIVYFGAGWNAQHGYAQPVDRALATGVANFLFLACSILLLALILHWLARLERSTRKSYTHALQVATYGAIPVLLAGAFLVLPVMVMLTLVAGMHSLFLYNGGLRKILGVGASEAPMLLSVAMVGFGLAAMALGAIAASIGLI